MNKHILPCIGERSQVEYIKKASSATVYITNM